MSERIPDIIFLQEPLARSNLALLLRGGLASEILAECGSGFDAPGRFAHHDSPAVLDVQIP
jgi:hypothetical protein